MPPPFPSHRFFESFPATKRLLGMGLLIGLCALVYGQTLTHSFVTWDDPQYVYQNFFIKNGLQLELLDWVATAFVVGNWHPLTLLSLQLDASLFGLWPGGFHLTNALWHAATSCLLFLFLHRATASTLRSLIVAALFAVHPLHVESVAWVSERKDVLSAFFWLLAMHAYLSYVRRPTLARYAWTTLGVVLALLSKPMAITLPFTLLLMDIWPLNRMGLSASFSWKILRQRLIEKLPWVALSGAIVTVTFMAQENAISTETQTIDRMETSFAGLGFYLARTLWPVDLSFMYTPDQASFKFMAIGMAGLVTWLYFGWRNRTVMPWLPVGGLWFLGTLLPVIGIITIGYHAFADRYSYIPHIGLFVAVVWTSHFVLQQRVTENKLRLLALAFAGGAVISLTVIAHKRTGDWRDSWSLYQSALVQNPQNHVAHFYLGLLLAEQGRLDEARFHADMAAKSPFASGGMLRLPHQIAATLAIKHGDLDLAYQHYKTGYEFEPKNAQAALSMGFITQRLGNQEQSEHWYRLAIKLNPSYSEAYNNLGVLLREQNRLREASEMFSQALYYDSSNQAARNNLAFIPPLPPQAPPR